MPDARRFFIDAESDIVFCVKDEWLRAFNKHMIAVEKPVVRNKIIAVEEGEVFSFRGFDTEVARIGRVAEIIFEEFSMGVIAAEF